MKFIKLNLIFLLFSSFLFSQAKPNYPEPKKGFKHVELELPKLENEDEYKIEITFGMDFQTSECVKAWFSFSELKTEYLIPPSRWQFYVVNSDTIEIMEGKESNCNSTKKITKKIYSEKKQFENYASGFTRHYYIPENWTLEYRVWNSTSNYSTIK